MFESSDISRLRADVQSLGFQSLITPGGAVRLVHAVARSFLSAFKVRQLAPLLDIGSGAGRERWDGSGWVVWGLAVVASAPGTEQD